jgi:hypothetical protein
VARPDLVRAVRTVKHSPFYRSYRPHLLSPTPADVWLESEQGLVIVTFHTARARQDGFYDVLAFSVDSDDVVRDTAFLSIGLGSEGWLVANDAPSE